MPMSTTMIRHAVVAGALLLATPGSQLAAQERAPEPLTLQEAIARAQEQGNASRAARSTRDAARQRDRQFGSTLLPQLSLTGTAPEYNRSIIPVVQPDGTTEFRPQQQSQTDLSMMISQRLPFTGGDLFVSSSLARLQISGDRELRNWSATPFLVGLRQQLFRPNALAWDSREQDLRIDVAERQYLEAREDIAIQTTAAFFDFYAARMALANAESNAAVNDTLYTLNKGRFEVGRIGENDLLQSELALLRSRTSVDGARLDHDRTLAALRLLLGLAPGAPLAIDVTNDVPLATADTALAVREALQNRAQVTELELQDVQARRRIREAQLNNGFGATVQASMGFNQTANDVGNVYSDLLQAQRFSVAVEMPLIQWGGRKAAIAAARADRDRVEATSRQAREQTVQDAHFAALELAQSARQLALSAKADTVAAKRFEVAKNRYVIGRIGIDNLYLAQNEKDQALLAYVQSLRGYWNAFYRLRRVTLWDFVAGEPIR